MRLFRVVLQNLDALLCWHQSGRAWWRVFCGAVQLHEACFLSSVLPRWVLFGFLYKLLLWEDFLLFNDVMVFLPGGMMRPSTSSLILNARNYNIIIYERKFLHMHIFLKWTLLDLINQHELVLLFLSKFSLHFWITIICFPREGKTTCHNVSTALHETSWLDGWFLIIIFNCHL